MNGLEIDHIVVAAKSLEEGAEYFSRTFGVRLEAGGKHDSMGTHNMLLRLGDACYLELIAIDGGAPRPARPRMFGLDSAEIQERLARGPRLLTWALRTTDITAAAARVGPSLGEITPMSRGNLRWRLTLPRDGAMPEGGTMPFLIEWATGPHPAQSMKPCGCSLEGLEIIHPDARRIEKLLREMGIGSLVAVTGGRAGGRPSLRASLTTPMGRKALD